MTSRVGTRQERPLLIWLQILSALLAGFAGSTVGAQSAESSVITVDTRDLQLGRLMIEGQAVVQPRHAVGFNAIMNGEDLTSRCEWWLEAITTFPAEWYRRPSISRAGIFDPHGLQPGDSVRILASITEPGGDVRRGEKVVTLGEDGGLYFGIKPTVTYVGPTEDEFSWNVKLEVEGLASGQEGVTFAWSLDGLPAGTGKSIMWQEQGRARQIQARVAGSDTAGHSATEEATVILAAGSPGEPGQRYDRWVKDDVGFLSISGTPMSPDPARKEKGLIVLVHGLRDSGTADWILRLAREIEDRYSAEEDCPNIVIFDWSEGAEPNLVAATEAEKLETISSSILIPAKTLSPLAQTGSGWIDFLYDLLLIRPVAESHGREQLVDWIREEADLGNISRSAPIHLIGHSAGGFVVAECARGLKKQNGEFQVKRVTLLDTPGIQPSHLRAINPAVLERYVTSFYGRLCPELDLPKIVNGSQLGFLFTLLPESLYYHRYDAAGGLKSYWPPSANEMHSEAYEWYTGTVRSSSLNEGFQLSPFVTGPGSLRRPRSPDGPAPDDEPTGEPVDGFESFGTVTSLPPSYSLQENGNAGITKLMTLPADAAKLRFNYRFSGASGDETLLLFFGDRPPLFLARPASGNATETAEAEVSLAGYAGLNDSLVIKLMAWGEADATVTIDSIQLFRTDDSDGDGLTASEEIAAGSDPRFADTDGDGLSDFDELHLHGAHPALDDSDFDGSSDGDEVQAGTDPLDSASRFSVIGTLWMEGIFSMGWTAVPGKSYRVLRSGHPSFRDIDVIGSGLVAEGPVWGFSDDAAGAQEEPRGFYKIEVE